MALKEIVGIGIVYAGLLGLANSGTQRIDGYVVRKSWDNQTELYPAPGRSDAVLVDENNDGTPDRKYTSIASRQGYWRHDLPITEKDRQVFRNIVSRL